MRPAIAVEGLRSPLLSPRRAGARPAAIVIALVLTLAACGDGRRAKLQIVVHARSVPAFGGRVRGVLLGAEAVRWSIDIVEIGGRPCRLTGARDHVPQPGPWRLHTRLHREGAFSFL